MVIVNIIAISKGTDNLLASSAPETKTPSSKSYNQKLEDEEESDEDSDEEVKKIRCRFCGKRYSSEYNGCPHCKKK